MEPNEHSKSALFHVFERSRSSTFHFEEGQSVSLAGPYDQKSFELIRAKSSALASRKSPYENSQSESRNLIWSDVPSSFPTIRCGPTTSTTEI